MNNYLTWLNDKDFHLLDCDPKMSLISVFSGGGGLDIGLKYAGFNLLHASDLHEEHCLTLRHNFPEALSEPVDICNLKWSDIRKKIKVKSVDLIAGGPPCQAFSILGQRNSFEDPRGALVLRYAEFINKVKPKAFLLENVPGLMTVNKGADWKRLLDYLEDHTGYNLHYDVLNAVDYGVPQIRKRVFIVGFKNKVDFNFPKPTHRDPSRPESLFEAGMPIWNTSASALEFVDGLPNHRIRIHGDRVRNRYLKVPQGGRDRTDHTDRIHPERPSGTVLVGSQAGGGRPFIHPFEPRHITIREAARLQSFPDWYEFQGPETWQFRAVGNAVPPLLAKMVGLEIRKALGGTV